MSLLPWFHLWCEVEPKSKLKLISGKRMNCCVYTKCFLTNCWSYLVHRPILICYDDHSFKKDSFMNNLSHFSPWGVGQKAIVKLHLSLPMAVIPTPIGPFVSTVNPFGISKLVDISSIFPLCWELISLIAFLIKDISHPNPLVTSV